MFLHSYACAFPIYLLTDIHKHFSCWYLILRNQKQRFHLRGVSGNQFSDQWNWNALSPSCTVVKPKTEVLNPSDYWRLQDSVSGRGEQTGHSGEKPVWSGPEPVLSLVRKVIFHSQVLGRRTEISPCHLHRRKMGSGTYTLSLSWETGTERK